MADTKGISVNEHGVVQCLECYFQFDPQGSAYNNGIFTHPSSESVSDELPGMKQMFAECENEGEAFHIASAPIKPVTTPPGMEDGLVLIERIAALEAERGQLRSELEQAREKFEEHTKHVSRFLSDMYAVMIDPLDQGNLKVSEMCDFLLHAACENRQALQDQIDRSGNLPANWKEDSSLETWFPLTAEELARTKAELEQARAQVARLQGSIDYRLNEHLGGMKPEYDDSITGFNEAWDIVREVFKSRTAPAQADGQLQANARFPRCKCGGVAVANASGDLTRTCIRCGAIVAPTQEKQ